MLYLQAPSPVRSKSTRRSSFHTYKHVLRKAFVFFLLLQRYDGVPRPPKVTISMAILSLGVSISVSIYELCKDMKSLVWIRRCFDQSDGLRQVRIR